MPTPIFQNKLQLFLEANELVGADGAAVTSFTDLSGYDRHLTASASKPLVKANAVNSKKSVIWNGSKNPLVYNGNFTIRCGWLVVKCNGNFGGDYEGILSSPAAFGILTGIGGSNLLFDFQYNYYEYRLNDRIYSPTVSSSGVKSLAAPAPTTGFGIIYFKFWQNLEVEGIQLGQDRNFTGRKFDGEVALLALYNREFCESDVRKNTQSIANSYQIALPDVFPFQGSRTDAGVVAPRILSDEQPEPVTRIKTTARETFDLSFQGRAQTEYETAKSYHKTHFPGERLIYRDYQHIPPVDFNARITSEFQKSGQPGFLFNYGFSVIESNVAAAAAVPAAPVIPSESNEIPDTEAPSVPEEFVIDGLVNPTTESTVSFAWAGSTDNVAVAEYQIQFATNSGFTTGVGSRNFAYPAESGTVTGLTPSTHYWFRIRAKDTSGNYSAWTTTEIDATTLSSDSEAPSVPDGLMLLGATTSSFYGQFNPSTDDNAVTGYELQHALDVPMTVEPTIVDIGNSIVGGYVQYNVTGLESDVEYYYRIRAYDAAGNRSDWSGIEFAHTDIEFGATNWALASNGATVTASTAYIAGREASSVINGARHTNNSFGSGNNCYVSFDAPSSGSPIEVVVEFPALRDINEINIFGLADAINYNTDPTLSDVGNTFKNIDFTVDRWNGSSWVNIATVTGNDKVWRQILFTTVSTTKIRMSVTSASTTNVYLVEIEAIEN